MEVSGEDLIIPIIIQSITSKQSENKQKNI